MWDCDYKAVKTEWDPTFDKEPSSSKVSRKMVCTDELVWIKMATNVRNICEANIDGQKKALVQSLKQFHTHYYQWYEKDMIHTMVGLQGLYLGNTLNPQAP